MSHFNQENFTNDVNVNVNEIFISKKLKIKIFRRCISVASLIQKRKRSYCATFLSV